MELLAAITFDQILKVLIIGVVFGAVYAVAAAGLVVTYTTTGIFNFAHGAIGMVMAFLYWELSIKQELPVLVALPLVLFVAAPLTGILLERILFRRLANAPVSVSLVVTVGLLVLFLGVAQTRWKPEARVLPQFFEGPDNYVTLSDVRITYHELTIIFIGLAVAGGLRLLLFNTRLGVAMRAVVDNRELAAQNGIMPERVAAAAWGIGVSLAAVAGILIAPGLGLDQIGLTLLVINGYAAAILGQLRSLPLTYLGAIVLGILQQSVIVFGTDLSFGAGWLGNGTVLNELFPVLPVIFLLGVLVFLPQARLTVGRVVSAATPRVPDLRTSLQRAAIFVGVAFVLSYFLSDIRLFDATSGLVLGMVMLSLVLLTGYGGQIALCQLTFVGIGALVMGKLFISGQLIGILVAAAITGVIGALVALPALRLQNLYLALVTFSVGLFADQILFDHPNAYDSGGNIFFDEIRLGPFDLSDDRIKFLVAAVGFALFGVIVLAVRRGPFGRALAAMSDSTAASATLGMNIVTTKVAVFSLSAAMAGAAGGLFAVTRGSAGALDFMVVESLFLFLLATIGGITTVTGAFIGGVVFSALPVIQKEFVPSIQLEGLFIGIGAIVISRTPNGFAGILYERIDRFRRPSRSAPTGRTATQQDDDSGDVTEETELELEQAPA